MNTVSTQADLPCTSKLQTWHRPSKSAKEASRPAFLRDISVRKITANTNVAEKANKFKRSDFDPRLPSHRRNKKIKEFDLDGLAEATNGKCGLLRFGLRKKHPIYFHEPNISDVHMEVEVTSAKPEQKICTVEFAFNTSDNYTQFLQNIRSGMENIPMLAAETADQCSDLWKAHRIGRITSSRIATCTKKISDTFEVVRATHSAVAEVMSYYEEAKAPQLLWGKNHESLARKLYVKTQCKDHRHFKVKQTGIWISTNNPVIASSPDGMVSCSCCGGGCLEIKCPWTHRFLPVAQYLQKSDACLYMDGEKVALKTEHDYFAQVQTHMYCTSTSWCDFVVYTSSQEDNIVVARVCRDNNYLKKLLHKAEIFFKNCIYSELQTRNVEKIVRDGYVKKTMDSILDKIEQNISQESTDSSSDFLCGSCAEIWRDGDQSIKCDKCSLWFHYKCVGICGEETFLTNDDKWFCESC